LDASAIEENDSKEKKAVCWFREMGDGLHGMLSSLGNIQDGVISFANVTSAKDPADVMFRYSVLNVAKMAPSINKKMKVVMTPQEYASLLGLNASWELEQPTKTSEDFLQKELDKLSGKKFSSQRTEILSMSLKLSSEWLQDQKKREENIMVAHALRSWRIETMQLVHDAVSEIEKVDDNYLPRARLSQGSSEEEKKVILLDVLISASLRFGFPNKAVQILDIVSENVGVTLQSYSALLCIVKGQLNKLDTEATKRIHDTAIADALASLCIEDTDLDDVFVSDANESLNGAEEISVSSDDADDIEEQVSKKSKNEPAHSTDTCGADGKVNSKKEEVFLDVKDGSTKMDQVGDAALAPLEGARAVAAAPVVGAGFTDVHVEEAAFATMANEAFTAAPVEDEAVTGAPMEGAAETEHAPVLTPENEPSAQLLHDPDPALGNMPAMQLDQEPVAVAEYVPAEQLPHEPEPTAAARLASQPTQETEPSAFTDANVVGAPFAAAAVEVAAFAAGSDQGGNDEREAHDGGKQTNKKTRIDEQD
jgi:hypothetical protein